MAEVHRLRTRPVVYLFGPSVTRLTVRCLVALASFHARELIPFQIAVRCSMRMSFGSDIGWACLTSLLTGSVNHLRLAGIDEPNDDRCIRPFAETCNDTRQFLRLGPVTPCQIEAHAPSKNTQLKRTIAIGVPDGVPGWIIL